MKVSQLKEQIRRIIREKMFNEARGGRIPKLFLKIEAVKKEIDRLTAERKSKFGGEYAKKFNAEKDPKKREQLTQPILAISKKITELQKNLLDLYAMEEKYIQNLDKDAELELEIKEAITNPKKTNPSDLAKTVLGWFDFYTDYIDDGGQRRRAIKNNEDTLVWFGSHPKDVKEKAYKIMLSQSKDKGQIERNFGKHLKESVIKEDTRRVKLLGIDFKVSEMNGRIFFSFVDKKAATIQLRKVGTNKIVNHIQNRLDIAYGKGEFFFKSGDHAEFQNGYLFQRNTSNINLNKIKFESVNEGLYHIGYNKGRGQGTGVFKDSYSSYKDAKKAVEKLEKERGGSYNTIAYYVADKDGKLVRESVIKEDIKKDIDKFIDKLNKQFPDQEYTISSGGGKYVRINHKNRKFGGGESAWGFISLVDNPTKGFKKGDLLKAAGYNTPAKHARGNILNGDAKYDKYSPTYLKEEINESTEPQVISQMRDIVKKKQYQDIKDPSSGKKMKVDMQTANTVLKIYDGLSNVNKQTMVKMGLPKMIEVSFKIINKYKK